MGEDGADRKSLLWLFKNARTPEAKAVAMAMLRAFAADPVETPREVEDYLIENGMWDDPDNTDPNAGPGAV